MWYIWLISFGFKKKGNFINFVGTLKDYAIDN